MKLHYANQLVNFFEAEQRLPTYREMLKLCGLKSTGAVFKIMRQAAAEGMVRWDKKRRKWAPEARLRELPLYTERVSAGFPSPAEDHAEMLDLNELLIENRPATYLLRVSGDSMKNAAICDGDILIVNASLKPKHGKIVVASVDGEFTVKRFWIERGQTYLKAENPAYPPRLINAEDEFMVVGVVTGVVREIKG